MKEAMTFLMSFILVLIGLFFVSALLVFISIEFISFLMSHEKLFGVIDSAVFDTIIVQNSTEYLALVIGLPVTILVSVIALSLAYLAYSVARRDERREAQRVIKDKRDASLEAFSVMATAINRVAIHASQVAIELNQKFREYGTRYEEYQHEYVDEEEFNRAIDELNRNQTNDYKKTLIELQEFSSQKLLPALEAMMRNAVCVDMLLEKNNVVCEGHHLDPLDILYRFLENGGSYIKTLSHDDICRIINLPNRIGCGLDRLENDRDSITKILYRPRSISHLGLFLVASIIRPYEYHRMIEKRDFEVIASRSKSRDPEVQQYDNSGYYEMDIESREDTYMAKEMFYVGPLIMSWLISCFPSQEEFRKRIDSFFEKKLYLDKLDDIKISVSPEKMILKTVREQYDCMKWSVDFEVSDDGKTVSFKRNDYLMHLVSIERVYEALDRS